MSNWYCSREAVKRAAHIWGAERDVQIDRVIEAVSRRIDQETRRFFIPKTETRLYRWPQDQLTRSTFLWLDQGLISITTLQSKAQDSTPTTIASTDYFLEPNNTGPPYNRIEIDLSSSAAFESGDTPQRSISVLGSWGYESNTRSTGTVSGSGLATDTTVTELVCSNASLINVGDTLLIESEQVFVSGRDFAARGNILIDGALNATKNEVTVTVDGSHGVVAGEIVRVDSEQMYVEVVSGNNLTVTRGYNGTVMAAHSDDTALHVNRTLTIERGVNGTTAATHAGGTAISVYEPPLDITGLVVAESIAMLAQEISGWGRQAGAGDGATELSGRALSDYRKRVTGQYRRMLMAAV